MGIEIYIGHISANVTEDEVKRLFSVAGTVTSVHLVKDSATGKLRGCGYVRMSTEEEARESIDLLNGAMLGDALIVVKNAPPKQSQKAAMFSGKSGDKNKKTSTAPRSAGAKRSRHKLPDVLPDT